MTAIAFHCKRCGKETKTGEISQEGYCFDCAEIYRKEKEFFESLSVGSRLGFIAAKKTLLSEKTLEEFSKAANEENPLVRFDNVIEVLNRGHQQQVNFDRLANIIFSKMSRLLEYGIEQEKAGNMENAIAVFEALIEEKFPGTLPYDRLRIYYSKNKNFAEAIRVCEKYVTGYGQTPTQARARKEFEDWILKYKHKLDKAI